MALGLGFGFGFGRIKGALGTIYPPTLTWSGDQTDTTPDFDVDLPSGNGSPFDAAVADVLRLEYSSNGGSVWNAYLTHPLTAGDISADTITVTGVTPIATGSSLFRARLERGSRVSDWPASETVTLVARWILEDDSGAWQLEDGTGNWILEAN